MSTAILAGNTPAAIGANDPYTPGGNASGPAPTRTDSHNHQEAIGTSTAALSADKADNTCDWDTTIAIFESRETMIAELCTDSIPEKQKVDIFLDKFGFMFKKDYIRLTGRKISDQNWLRLAGTDRLLTSADYLSETRFEVIDKMTTN